MSLEFLILVPNDIMGLDNVWLENVDASSITGLRSVGWNNGKGFTEPATGFGMTNDITDITPYIPVINNWLTVASNQNPAISLAQAQQVKSEMVDELFNTKRQAVIAFNALTWDATDQAVAAMSAALSSYVESSLDSAIVKINTVVTTGNSLVSEINAKPVASGTALVTEINSKPVASGTALVAEINAKPVASGTALVAEVNAKPVASGTALVTEINSKITSPINTIIGPAIPSPSNVLNFVLDQGTWSNGNFSSYSQLTASGTTFANLTTTFANLTTTFANLTTTFPAMTTSFATQSGNLGNINWTASGASSPTLLSVTQLCTLAGMISSRQQTLQGTANGKKTAIAGLATVADVIAYDVTTGW